MTLDMNVLKNEYEQSKGWREVKKWAFAIGTLGLGALYLWSTTVIIKEGEIGLRRNSRGQMTLLPPGRHSNFPWESYPEPPQSLSRDHIALGPYTILTVHTGFVAKTYYDGTLVILEAGRHLMRSATHKFNAFVSIKQETKELPSVVACTQDNVEVDITSVVRYQIQDPAAAIGAVHDIERTITDLATITLQQTIRLHKLEDFMATANRSSEINHSLEDESTIDNIVHQITQTLSMQLQQFGIKLLMMGNMNWSFRNKELQTSLASSAVTRAQNNVLVYKAKLDAEANNVRIENQAACMVTLARSGAEAIRIRAAAVKEASAALENNTAAHDLYIKTLMCDVAAHAKNPYLFFGMNGGANTPPLSLPSNFSPNQIIESSLN